VARYEPGKAIYVVAERFVDVALRRDDSLFTPGAAIWSLPWLEELDRRYVQNPDAGTGSFEQKLHAQLAEASPQSLQLMAELL
jgi:5-methylcytosine-specific restriction protein B